MEMGFAAGTAANGGGGAAAATNGGGGGKAPAAAAIREQDRLMPIANVIRIMRRVLPPHAKISDDAKETIQECVSEYISFITGEANERCQREQRKTITAEDVLWAMSRLGFDDYVHPLGVYLHRFREFEGEARGGGLGAGAGGSLRSPRGGPAPGSASSMVPGAQHHHDMQMHAAAMYGNPMAPPHHHAFLMPQPHYGQQYEMYGGGEHGMGAAAYYGGGYAPGNGGHNGDSGSGGGGANTPQAVNFEHQQPFGYK
ncbi:nuclear transcription factor Y subunit B-3 [Brachypodium distachyon]|uniref:Transcription factor CBF/NF-Y/archaeal histone domain-containing protein n=1 Tax=Brachypodium distachyon TaxID=15368 RepID=I1IEB5_BRADI|nr:nuclear transcription factor Y subunit B-3 [Brachypodium distachyon]KQK01520.1 hypothetical protein BRADI_3g56400v3 [Brachypodium distachyon]|eukprot:XP_003570473.1 nuclear transcription factor Y subunit B-3 [Brachypodium distachyon]